MSNEIVNNTDFHDIIALIEAARLRVFKKANQELILLYLRVGEIVANKIKQGAWGEGTVDQLALEISSHYPGLKGFNRRGLYRMRQFFETYYSPEFVTPLVTQLQKPEKEVKEFVTSLVTQISWTQHLLILSKTKTTEERLFYIHLCINEKLSKRDLERQLNTATYERTTIAAKSTLQQSAKKLPGSLFKDPYVFEFLDLPVDHSERELEQALVSNLKNFILEIGKGFSYLGNQYRLQVGNKDYYTDLLFYHRDLQCLVMFELKIQEFEPEFLGKLNFYLEALDKDVKRPHENPSIGVLLCKGKDVEVVEYAMARNTSPALIADYETRLIPKNILAEKLNQLLALFEKEEKQNE